MTLFPIQLNDINQRDYYKDTKHKQTYCKEFNEWYFCSKDGEPQEELTALEVSNITIE
jgi:hypothetical protein